MMLGTATGSQGGYMRSVSTSATSVYVYIVALGWLVVPELFCPPSRYNLVWGDLGHPLNFYQRLFRNFCHFCIANGATFRVYYHQKCLTDPGSTDFSLGIMPVAIYNAEQPTEIGRRHPAHRA
ncbi:uncharacterized protein ARMOST_16764 [Armillaria ostoyae]|uniref:Uncharacterized protein n=1 Tax=Armillaria ostoyae TaxID=47428 RepID=A0A284RX34_ARMOS|nr:uncharacterized protein ARMOST_16764 [Armillaria ostoyae]